MLHHPLARSVIVLLFLISLSASAATPEPLREAFNKLMEDQGRWAYTERQHVAAGKKSTSETVLRVDPSLKYTEQYKPLRIEGREPSRKDLKKCQDLGEWLAQNRQENAQTEHQGEEVHILLFNQSVVPDLANAVQSTENEVSLTYIIPLRIPDKGSRLFDNFELSAQVAKANHEFQHATLRQKVPMRVKLIAKFSEAKIDFVFASPDAAHPATIIEMFQSARVAVLGFKKNIDANLVRSDFTRVTPYDERFGVKIGPAKTLQF